MSVGEFLQQRVQVGLYLRWIVILVAYILQNVGQTVQHRVLGKGTGFGNEYLGW